MISMELLFSCFSIRIRFVVRKYRGYGILSNILSMASKAASAVLPSHHDYRPVSEFRCYGTKVLSRQNTTPSLEDLEYNETCVPRLSDQDTVLIVIAISQVIISVLADDDLHT